MMMPSFSTRWYRALGALLMVCIVAAPTTGFAQSQEAVVKGTVQTANGDPAPGVNVRLKGTRLGSTSDRQGRYRIDDVPAGTYTLVVSYVGLETQRRTIRAAAGATVTVPSITLEETTRQLEELVVRGMQRNIFSVDQSVHVAKLPLQRIDNPQVYNAISNELLDSQVVTTLEGALTNAPGVFKLWESTGRQDGSGYYSIRGFSTQPTMQNGLPALTNGSPDPVNVERIEIIKGPSATLYGSSQISYGGLINVVTEKPYEDFGGEVGYTTGSFGLQRVTADVNTPLGNEDLLLRVNGAFDSRESFQDAGFSRSVFLAPSLSYDATDRLSFRLDASYYTSEHTNPTMLFMNRSVPLEANTVEELGYNPNNSLTDNDLTISTPTISMQGQARYEISEQWTSQTALSRSVSTSDGYYSYLWDMASNTDTFTRYISDQNATTTATDIQQNFNGQFEVLGTQHKMVVGLDYFQERLVSNSSGYVGFDTVTLGTPAAGLSSQAVDEALAQAASTNSVSAQETYSAYASDVIQFIPQVSFMASLRVDYFDQQGVQSSPDDNFTQTALSPKFGLVIQPLVDRLSLFANYMNGFSNVAPRTQGDGSIRAFAPEQANQWETGIKADLWSDRLTATVSYYDITVSNVVRQDPTRPNFFVQDGKITSRGIETSLSASPLPGLELIAGYSYNQSETVNTAPDFEGDRPVDEFVGLRPEEAGPKHLANVWARYRVRDGLLKGVGIGLGGNYASENVVLNRQSTGRFVLDSFTVLNAALSYTTARYRLSLKVDNLTDETYYRGWTTINPQAPRSIRAAFTYKF
ncbi:TonB-dependent receptor [Salisaeta longa]|uniref:TonB-dependent receptor n=1 Tax=Salisaeta longa TaxID=503170 RepID=UPI001B7FA777|nr:TonB-dependent receptor [Salisaeta longa]